MPRGGKPVVFVVHGHDTDSLNHVELTLRRVGAQPMILGQEATAGAITIVERLESLLPAADAVVCLLTPDDEGRRRGTGAKLAPRARENVLVEAGYAVLSRRARSVVVALGGVSIPSDFDGVLRVQDAAWSKDTALALARNLEAMGLAVSPIEAARESKRATVPSPSRAASPVAAAPSARTRR